MRSGRKRILCDCDGVLLNYCQGCFDLIREHTGREHTLAEVTHWDVFTVLGHGDLKPELKKRMREPGWCLDIPPIEGAIEFVERLEELGEVVMVTSPMSSPHWSYEREISLRDNFGIPKSRVIHTEGKHYVEGDVIIDDSVDHCINWLKAWPDGKALLFDAPYNRDADLTGTGVVRVSGYAQALDIIEGVW